MTGMLIAIGFVVVFLLGWLGAQTAIEKFVEMRNDARAYRLLKKGNDEK